MLKNKKIFINKKAVEISIKTIVRLIIALAVLFLVVFPACNKLRSYFFGADTGSFETFVEGINEMSSKGTERAEQFVLQLNEKSAVIGFGKNTNDFKCYCGSKTSGLSVSERLNIIINKPNDPECANNACVCLCDIETESQTIDGADGLSGRCIGEPLCIKLNDGIDIADKTKIEKTKGLPLVGSDWYKYWDKSFLFYRGVSPPNGLTANQDEITILHVQRQGNIIGVCNEQIMTFNKEKLKFDGCINKDKD